MSFSGSDRQRQEIQTAISLLFGAYVYKAVDTEYVIDQYVRLMRTPESAGFIGDKVQDIYNKVNVKLDLQHFDDQSPIPHTTLIRLGSAFIGYSLASTVFSMLSRR
eukprot:TRINITY_DN5957_c0_g1_i2.p1 TRINITY_DN5957_c0_g1~~TRINITY_DN5957_c0_g1_i2.p1  ORF type:complete len:106 (-),score=22.44 TRINITY_DN5957_c0_g1_i2:88-405(-)